ncbi:MAG: lipopolysaccharide assembly protein LapA domain-containing protein [Candidatus Binatia bacterium]
MAQKKAGDNYMLVLLVAVISGIAIAYFGMQNVSPVTIWLNEFVWNDVPLYLVIVGSLLVGLFMAGILYFARSVSSTLTIYGKDRAMKKTKHTVADLEQRVHDLEAEKARLNSTRTATSEIPHHTLS